MFKMKLKKNDFKFLTSFMFDEDPAQPSSSASVDKFMRIMDPIKAACALSSTTTFDQMSGEAIVHCLGIVKASDPDIYRSTYWAPMRNESGSAMQRYLKIDEGVRKQYHKFLVFVFTCKETNIEPCDHMR